MPAPAGRVVYGLRISPLDLLLVYAIPLAAVVTGWLLLTLGVLLLARSHSKAALRGDVLRRYQMKREIRSGQRLKLSYGFVARLMGDTTFWATMLYRLSHLLARKRLGPLANVVHTIAKVVTSADLNPKAQIGPGFYLYHGIGTVIGRGSHLGRNALVCQGVTTGDGRVRIGDDVSLWAGAKVIGNVSVGDRCDIGANAVVLTDIPADVTAVGVPATRLIPKNPPQAE